MVVTGFGSFGSGGGSGKAEASVNGIDITEQELRAAIERRRDQLIQRQNIDPNDEQLKDEVLREPVLAQLKRELAMSSQIENSGMVVSDQELVKSIQSMPVFQDENGKFDSQVYSNLLAQNGYSSASFKAEERNRLAQAQNEAALGVSSFTTQAEIDQLVSFLEQTRDFYSVEVSKLNVADSVEVSDEDIADYYKANPEEFTEPEKVIADYLELSVDSLMNTIEVSEEDIAAEYAARKDAFQASDQFDISHVLIEKGDDDQKKIAQVSTAIKANTDFSEIAKQFSDDIGSKNNDGNLGVFSLDSAGFDKAFNAAVRSLEEGQISDAVETPDGFHFIKLNKKIANQFAPLSEKREEIVNDLKRTNAEQIFVDQRELLAEAAFGAEELDQVAQAIGATVRTTKPFSQNSGEGIATESLVRNTAFSNELRGSNRVSEVLDVSPSKSYVLKIKEVQAPFLKSLDDVRVAIAANLRNRQITQATVDLANTVRKRIESGEDPKSVAEELKLDFRDNKAAKRFGANSSPAISSKAFTIPAPKAGETAFDVTSTKGGSALIGLTGINMGKQTDLEPERVKGIRGQIARQGQNFESVAYRAAVVDNADIK